MEPKLLLDALLNKQDLTQNQMTSMMEGIMEGRMTHIQMAALLIALRAKGETVEEITAAAKVMRAKATLIKSKHPKLLDTCGTGGDGVGSINISTTSALLLAGGGYKVAKHGNRSMSSKSGSADLLEALGININLTAEQVGHCLDEVGIGFLFAPALHGAMKNVMPVRKELAVRTLFNILGPLTNPAHAQYQMMGLFSDKLVSTIIRVLKGLGLESAYVFSGLSGIDEVCLEQNSKVAFLDKAGQITEFEFNPEEYGFVKAPLSAIQGGSPAENAQVATELLAGRLKGPKRDVVVLNAGFAISALEPCSLAEGFKRAGEMADSGVGMEKLESFKAFTQQFKSS